MCEGEDELVDDPIDANSSTDKFKSRIIGIVKDEVIKVELA